MKREYDLAELEWTLSGHTPHLWQFEETPRTVDVPPIPARVPGSVQGSLREAGVIPDWNVGLNARHCEWVENRHWIYRTAIPNDWLDHAKKFRLHCLGLDYSGWILVNDRQVSTFQGSHVPHVFDLTSFLNDSDNILEIVFDLPPRWLGQFGYTSRMTQWKPRFNYTWDWVPRLVQIGIWDSITLVATDGEEIEQFRCTADAELSNGKGRLTLSGRTTGDEGTTVRVCLTKDGAAVATTDFDVSQFERGIVWPDLAIDLWWPNQEGEQPLYELGCQIFDGDGSPLDEITRRVGFKHVIWEQCANAPEGADSWICVVNGRRIFLQGVNFAPIRPNFADLTRADYAARLELYRDLGCNMLRINACGFLERKWFYDLCDEFGIMVWQEFPLTSSGIDNWPPEDEASIAALVRIAESFIERRRHHVSLTLWSGGNELQGDLEGRKTGTGKPCDLTHPMLKRLREIVEELDPGRRYIPTSPSGPRANAQETDFGKGLHWNVHGPYTSLGSAEKNWDYWSGDDALFRAELCCPGANPIEITRQYRGDYPEFPPTADNEYWTHPTSWWIDWPLLVELHGREPRDLQEYVTWSQEHQAETLALGMRSCKERFPRCGGVLLWGSHDTSPLPINTSIIDFHGNPKPAAMALKEVWRTRKSD
jgi:beta-mannosidase